MLEIVCICCLSNATETALFQSEVQKMVSINTHNQRLCGDNKKIRFSKDIIFEQGEIFESNKNTLKHPVPRFSFVLLSSLHLSCQRKKKKVLNYSCKKN